MKNKLFSISLIFMFFLVLATVASAAQVTKIGSGLQPAIDGSKVTWSDTSGRIHLYDVTAKKGTTISSDAASYPAISGNKLVWHNRNNGVSKLTVYDIKTGARSQITKNVDSYSKPAIYGNRIVWGAGGNVYMRDVSTSTQTKIAVGNDPDIYGNRVSYDSDSAGSTPQIYVYDITNKKAVDASEYGDNLASHIYGNKVIWSDFNIKLGNIRMYDIATKQQTEVTTGDDMTGYDTGGATDISGNKIVYLKHNDLAYTDLGDVFVYNIATGKSTKLSSGNRAQTPFLSGSVVVWSDSGSIYMTDLSATNIKPQLPHSPQPKTLAKHL